jgi:pimeloyl-ACP methyl ester carboxylesterase
MSEAQRTFVLVHGAWHGGWCWRRVADLLEHRGHRVFTPTLTGLGERSHLMSADINLDTHIADVVNVLKWEDLKDVVLVAHSYGGWPVSGAIEQTLDRIASVVYLDAFVPKTDKSRSIPLPISRERPSWTQSPREKYRAPDRQRRPFTSSAKRIRLGLTAKQRRNR